MINIANTMNQIIFPIISGLVIAAIAGVIGRYIGSERARKERIRSNIHPILSEELELVMNSETIPHTIKKDNANSGWGRPDTVCTFVSIIDEEVTEGDIQSLSKDTRRKLRSYLDKIEELNKFEVSSPEVAVSQKLASEEVSGIVVTYDPSKEHSVMLDLPGTNRISPSLWIRCYYPALITAEGPNDLEEKIKSQSDRISDVDFVNLWNTHDSEWHIKLWDIIEEDDGRTWANIRENREKYQELCQIAEELSIRLDEEITRKWYEF